VTDAENPFRRGPIGCKRDVFQMLLENPKLEWDEEGVCTLILNRYRKKRSSAALKHRIRASLKDLVSNNSDLVGIDEDLEDGELTIRYFCKQGRKRRNPRTTELADILGISEQKAKQFERWLHHEISSNR